MGISKMKQPEPLMSWTLVSLIPRSSILGRVDEVRYKLNENIQSTIKDMESNSSNTVNKANEKIHQFETKLIVITVCVIVVFIVLAVIFAILITRPIINASTCISVIAHSLDTDSCSIKHSQVKEVELINSSIQILLDRIIEYKKFMPQSLLCNLKNESYGQLPSGNNLNLSGSMKLNRTSPTTVFTSQASFKSNYRPNPVMSSAASLIASTYNNIRTSITYVVVKMPTPYEDFTYSKLLDEIHKKLIETRGVVDYFREDVIAFHFNASTPVSDHRNIACSVCLDITSINTTHKWNIGITTQTALVGNIGGKSLRSFAILGGIQKRCEMLCQIAQDIGVSIAMDRKMGEAVHGRYNYRLVDTLIYDGSRQWVYELVSLAKRQQEECEWMYELGALESTISTEWEVAVRSLLDENPALGYQNLLKLEQQYGEDPQWKRLIKIAKDLIDHHGVVYKKLFGIYSCNCIPVSIKLPQHHSI
eukprot:NODE_1932_length_1747_cov_44.344212_g1644_i0.p1 GENE.NODE_1932_length_1747_cov_44.344212_g1644_i0~~NODE_1932_length_1747_cov_44.344212_g1644_i0.p1  ORF type:complete len:537 (-),score=87.39 NODE_1932_length_1747_cov_44.344212_g1644_i0:137-1567(-)